MKVRGCRDMGTLLGAYVDRELDPHEAAAVAAHLAACPACQAEYAALERADRAVLALGQVELSAAELDDLAARVRARLAPAEEGSLARARRELRRFGEVFTWRRLVPVAAAAAVVLLLVVRLNEPGFRGREDEPARGQSAELAKQEATAQRAPVAIVPQSQEGPPPAETAPAAAGKHGGTAYMFKAPERARDEAVTPGAAPAPEPRVPAASLAAREAALPESQVAVDVLAPSAAPMRTADAAPSLGARAAVPGLRPGQKIAAADYALATPGEFARGRDLLARGQPAAAAAVLDSLLVSLPPGDPSPGARAARALRLEAAAAIAGPDPDRQSERQLAALYDHFSREESDPGLAVSWAARSIELTAAPREAEKDAGAGARPDAGADTADCRLLAARIRDFVARFPGDGRTDSLAAAGARLPCAP